MALGCKTIMSFWANKKYKRDVFYSKKRSKVQVFVCWFFSNDPVFVQVLKRSDWTFIPEMLRPEHF